MGTLAQGAMDIAGRIYRATILEYIRAIAELASITLRRGIDRQRCPTESGRQCHTRFKLGIVAILTRKPYRCTLPQLPGQLKGAPRRVSVTVVIGEQQIGKGIDLSNREPHRVWRMGTLALTELVSQHHKAQWQPDTK